MCVGDQNKAGISLDMKNAGVWDMKISRIKKFYFFIKKAIYKIVKILYNIYEER